MTGVRYISAIVLCLLIIGLVSLPHSPRSDLFTDSEIEKYHQLPDFDFRSEAINSWEVGDHESALLLLNEIIKNDLPDKAAAQQLKNDYTEEMEKRNSALGRITAMGSSFVTGEVNSFEELAGASLADFFMYGDIRDLTKELIFEEDGNDFIIALSGLGLLTTVFPPADPLASVLKTSHKSGSLSDALIKQLKQVLSPLKNGAAKLSLSSIKSITSQLKPIWTMAQNSKSWQQFSLFLKNCQNLKQVKFINKVISTAGNRSKLESVLTSLKGFPKRTADSLAHIHKYGQKGMDSLYSVYRKGPAGIQFILKNPKLYTRLAKNTAKASQLSSNMFFDSWSKLLNKYGTAVNFARYALIILFILLLKTLFWNRRPSDKTGSEDENVKGSTLAFNLTLAVTVSLLIYLFANMGQGQFSLDLSSASNSSSGNISLSAVVFFLLFSSLQLWAVFKAKNEVSEIEKLKDEEKKIKLLENSEFYFDLPVYAGLAGTVCAFILLSFDPGGSRILAYLTTVSGIIISVAIRGKWLFPAKKQIIYGENHE